MLKIHVILLYPVYNNSEGNHYILGFSISLKSTHLKAFLRQILFSNETFFLAESGKSHVWPEVLSLPVVHQDKEHMDETG